MSLAIVYSRAQVGVEAPAVTVEVHLANGLPALTLVGLPETAVKESKDRVRSAILNSGFDFPARRITLNLAPADLPKDGGRFDLAIALGILAASGQMPAAALEQVECLGELALSGAIRPVQGVLPAALVARAAGRALVVPMANAEEASLASGLTVIAARFGQLTRGQGDLQQRRAVPVQIDGVVVESATHEANDTAAFGHPVVEA